MIYTKESISRYAKESGFISGSLEKVIRLLDVLDFLFSESAFKDKLILKGGTAINLVHTNLKRLSVDIDLDYCGSFDKDITFSDRERLEKEIDNYMIQEEYEVSPKSRSSFALFSRVYKYMNAAGNSDTIKVDVNFMDRVHLYSPITHKVTYFDKTVILKTPSIEELFGMKINALIDRKKPRDLYDTFFLVENIKSFDKNKLRKAVVFYLSLNNIFEISSSLFDKINAITQQDIKTELQPVLKKGEIFNLENSKKIIIDVLNELIALTGDEKQYLIEFSRGNYNPLLLLDEKTASKVEKYPMAKWRVANLTK